MAEIALNVRPAPRLTVGQYVGSLSDGKLYKLAQRLRETDADVCGTPKPENTFYIHSPAALKHVLVSNASNYDKDHWLYHRLSKGLGQGLVTSYGTYWQQHRKIIQPIFHANNYQMFANTIVELTQQHLKRWTGKRKLFNKAINITTEMEELALSISANLYLSGDGCKNIDLIRKAVAINQVYVPYTISTHKYWPSYRNARFSWIMPKFHSMIHEIITERQQNPNPASKDLLDLLLQGFGDDHGKVTDYEVVVDEVKTLLISGYETAATTLAWCFFHIVKYPKFAELIYQEIDALLGQRPATLADCDQLIHTKMLVEESMRLYPAIWITWRRAIRKDVICGKEIPRHAGVCANLYSVHRNPQYFDDPDEFNPWRFHPEVRDQIVKYSYLPFGAGPRSCIAQRLAVPEMILIIATVLQQFRFKQSLVADAHPGLRQLVTLKPKRPILLHVRER